MTATTCPSERLASAGPTRISAERVPTVVIDTREQLPYRFPASAVRTLATGDYSLEGLEDRVAIERKTKEDAYNCIGRERDRFEREIERLAQLEYGAVVIEATLQEFLEPPAHSQVHPRSAIGSLLAWSVKHHVHVYFAGDRRYGNALTAKLLEKFWRYRTEVAP